MRKDYSFSIFEQIYGTFLAIGKRRLNEYRETIMKKEYAQPQFTIHGSVERLTHSHGPAHYRNPFGDSGTPSHISNSVNVANKMDSTDVASQSISTLVAFS
jgi:hypothetical protein